jgi:hypothetical protein
MHYRGAMPCNTTDTSARPLPRSSQRNQEKLGSPHAKQDGLTRIEPRILFSL